jgi:hypothetical protein
VTRLARADAPAFAACVVGEFCGMEKGRTPCRLLSHLSWRCPISLSSTWSSAAPLCAWRPPKPSPFAVVGLLATAIPDTHARTRAHARAYITSHPPQPSHLHPHPHRQHPHHRTHTQRTRTHAHVDADVDMDTPRSYPPTTPRHSTATPSPAPRARAGPPASITMARRPRLHAECLR